MQPVICQFCNRPMKYLKDVKAKAYSTQIQITSSVWLCLKCEGKKARVEEMISLIDGKPLALPLRKVYTDN